MTTMTLALAMLGILPTVDDAVPAVRNWIQRNVSGVVTVDPVPLKDDAMEGDPLGFRAVALHFREFPVQMMPPAPLAPRSVFLVDRQERVRLLKKREELDELYKSAKPTFATAELAAKFAAAFLVVSREFSQDGFFKFEKPQVQPVSDGKADLSLRGVAAVVEQAGDKGALTVNFHFDGIEGGGYRLVGLKSSDDILPGVRPVCQSTLLLDPNPVVRRMAERDLLVMGEACLPYLQEQREKVSPELQKEIDRVVARIKRGER
ncbi:MAG: hypothetical protein KIT11_00870 [Fimbriimonadaceae bacterium]|nr:hypothetical protein [Fimbriimonadaceae bacterium]QYK55074.1 MAG: hypothetical protein KF733_08665 [Fimbriimonadaceae bacterium]